MHFIFGSLNNCLRKFTLQYLPYEILDAARRYVSSSTDAVRCERTLKRAKIVRKEALKHRLQALTE